MLDENSNQSIARLSNSVPVWQWQEVIRWSNILAESYRQLLGTELIAVANSQDLANVLFHAPFALVSHGIQADPILNYGNQTALQLWNLTWTEFSQTPSRMTAEPVNRATRAKMLEQASKQGYINNYRGIRISSTGQRFAIAGAIIWNLTDEWGRNCGQAATFSNWKWL